MAEQPRLRVFAGPNGSGKSTMYRQVRMTKLPHGRRVDLGVYVNPDDIGARLHKRGKLYLRHYRLASDQQEFRAFAIASGLLRKPADERWFDKGHAVRRNVFHLHRAGDADRFAQILTQYIVDRLIAGKQKCSFETVFSHPSKVAIMERARAAGYKVYLYFIATNSPEINKDRVKTRVQRGGHDVPPDRIESRYHRSLKQLPTALDLCYHAFMFDNSPSGQQGMMFGEMKITANGRSWFWIIKAIPDWFIKSYLLASGDPLFLDVARQVMEEREH